MVWLSACTCTVASDYMFQVGQVPKSHTLATLLRVTLMGSVFKANFTNSRCKEGKALEGQLPFGAGTLLDGADDDKYGRAGEPQYKR